KTKNARSNLKPVPISIADDWNTLLNLNSTFGWLGCLCKRHTLPASIKKAPFNLEPKKSSTILYLYSALAISLTSPNWSRYLKVERDESPAESAPFTPGGP